MKKAHIDVRSIFPKIIFFIAMLFLDYLISELFVCIYMEINSIGKRGDLANNLGFGVIYSAFIFLVAAANLVALFIFPFLARSLTNQGGSNEKH